MSCDYELFRLMQICIYKCLQKHQNKLDLDLCIEKCLNLSFEQHEA